MQNMSSREVRSRFLEFFEKKGHTIVSSSSLVPSNDPTLIFTSAGMVQFKDVFLGNESRPYKTATTSQKCMRAGGKHNDLENVGPSIRHHTFFEMLGNFSFGQYFKREAIAYAWELLTEGFGLDPDRLWPTIYLDDDESFQLWQEVAGVPANRITRRGAEDNFWSMGDTGPCGPNTEIYWDFYPERGETADPATDEDRFFEIWNLVFMQFDQPGDGSMVPLEHPGVDTGMGLERVSVVLQGVHSNYETDLFVPIMEKVQQLTEHSDEEREQQIASYRVIADHSRAATFLIGDGVLPSNEWRGYVLRRVMRRALVHGRRIGLNGPFLSEIADTVIAMMGDIYPEIVQRRDFILRTIQNEEESFGRTLIAGLNRFDQVAATLNLQPGNTFPGEEVFRLYDTFGLSKELVIDLAAARDFEVDMDAYNQAMSRQREQSKESSVLKGGKRESLEVYQQISPEPTRFLGYDYSTLEGTPGKVLGIVLDKEAVDVAGEGQEVEVVLDQTPFYPEGGGQVGDKGTIEWEGGKLDITDTRRPVAGIIVHRGKIAGGTLRTGAEVRTHVPAAVRWDTMRNHTATHLLHKALRDTLGTHVHQAGSVVEPGRLRFDFTHNQQVTHEQVSEIERIVNEQIRSDYPVQATEMSLQAAQAEGAMALFGEKYGSVVRMVRIPGYESKELCGGTHVERTGQIGAFFITYESSIGSGVRRMEAVTGGGAIEYAQERRDTVSNIAARLQVTPNRAVEQVGTLQEQLREANRRVEELQRRIARGETGALSQQVQQIDGLSVITGRPSVTNMDGMREAGDHLRDKIGSGVVVLGALIEGQPKLLAMVTQDAIGRGLSAGNIIKEIAPAIEGRGGGPANMAQGGGKNPDGLDAALGMVTQVVARTLGIDQ